MCFVSLREIATIYFSSFSKIVRNRVNHSRVPRSSRYLSKNYLSYLFPLILSINDKIIRRRCEIKHIVCRRIERMSSNDICLSSGN